MAITGKTVYNPFVFLKFTVRLQKKMLRNFRTELRAKLFNFI